jgi:uncharacterized membrane protein
VIAALASVLRWSLFIAVMAIGAHFMTLAYLPGILMSKTISGIVQGEGYNTMRHLQRSDASTRWMVRPDPGTLVSACAFNLAQSQVLIEAPFPAQGHWSLTLYDDDARPFYFASNEAAGTAKLAVALIEPGGVFHGESGAQVITSPSFDGVALIRTLIESDAGLAEAEAARHHADCRAIPRQP